MGAKVGTVLIADSEADSRAALMWFLLSMDFRVEAVANGLDAAAAMDNSVPDVAIISLYLPVFDGRRLINHMRGAPRLSRVPIIAMAPTPPFAPLPAGIEFLLKSCQPSDILAAIAAVTRGRLVCQPNQQHRPGDILPPPHRGAGIRPRTS